MAVIKRAAKESGAPDMSRNTALAGQTVSKGGYNITYNDKGYAVSASNYNHSSNKGTDRGVAAPSADAVLSGGSRSSSGGSSYDRSTLNDKELSHLTTLQNRWNEANKAGDQDAMDRAHAEAEAIRARYGYSGGDSGSGYTQLDYKIFDPDEGGSGGGGGYSGSRVSGGGYSPASGGSYSAGGVSGNFTYENAPQYVNRYKSQIDDLTAQILGRAAFSYDPETDPAYQQYRESYTRSGQRAMQDTLAQVSARTGGLASSYAGSAAQQTYDNYMAALADKVPELRQLAYSMYQDEGNTLRNNLNMLASLEQGDYAKFADQLGQYNTDRSFNYGMYRDQIADDRYNNEWNYNLYRDQIADQRYNTEWNYNVGRDQIADRRYNDETAYNRNLYSSETEYNRALDRAKTLAAIGDYSGYKALGYSDAEIANMTNAYNAAQLLAQRSGGSSGSRGSGGSGGGSTAQNTGIVDTMLSFENDNQAYEYLIGLGYSNSKTDTLWEMYKNSKGTSSGVGSTGSGGLTGGFSGVSGNGTTAGDILAGALNGFMFGQSGASALPSSVRNTVNEQLSSDKTQQALGYIDSIWSTLTASQREELQALLSRHGVSYNP